MSLSHNLKEIKLALKQEKRSCNNYSIFISYINLNDPDRQFLSNQRSNSLKEHEVCAVRLDRL
jgi:hypothetical protein